jgi:hypothetical protein
MSNENEKKNKGTIPINHLQVFNWLRSNDGEVFGHVEGAGAEIVPKTAGFYRTNDPEVAVLYAKEKLKEVEDVSE